MHKQLRAPSFLPLLLLPLLLMTGGSSPTGQPALNTPQLTGREVAFGVHLAFESMKGAGSVHKNFGDAWVVQNR